MSGKTSLNDAKRSHNYKKKRRMITAPNIKLMNDLPTRVKIHDHVEI